MEYQGYEASIRYSSETDSFHGKIENVEPRDLILFEGRSVDDLREDFASAIVDYGELLRRSGREPVPVG